MSIFQNIFRLSATDKLQAPTSKKRIVPQLKRAAPSRVSIEMSVFKAAVMSAGNTDNPNRIRLYQIYAQILQDSHLYSQIRTAKLSVMKSDFELLKNGKPDEAAKELLSAGWFDRFIDLALDAEFWGHSLIEFGLLNAEGKFDSVSLIPRPNVRPEFATVVMLAGDEKGIVYEGEQTEWALIEIGERFDLGLLEAAAREVITKNYARNDWSQASEKYGMPLLKIKTNTQDSKELDRLESMAQSFASNGYVIMNNDDDAEIIQIKETDFYKIYLENITHCNENISKLINGQTMTADNGSSYGQASVHERILNDYTFSRLRRMQHIINTQLIPFLVKWGYPLADYRLQYTDLLPKQAGIETEPRTLSLTHTRFSD